MTRFNLVVLLTFVFALGCNGEEFTSGQAALDATGPEMDGSVAVVGTGGAPGTGGAVAVGTGGEPETDAGSGSGGRGAGGASHGTGGSSQTGGAPGTGGVVVGTGGAPGTGGSLGTGGDAVDACAPVTHNNGAGQTWQDCVPLGTYDNAQAKKACAAWCDVNSCVGACFVSFACGVEYELAQVGTTGSGVVLMGWSWKPPNSGSAVKVNSGQTSCPVAGTWN